LGKTRRQPFLKSLPRLTFRGNNKLRYATGGEKTGGNRHGCKKTCSRQDPQTESKPAGSKRFRRAQGIRLRTGDEQRTNKGRTSLGSPFCRPKTSQRGETSKNARVVRGGGLFHQGGGQVWVAPSAGLRRGHGNS